MRQHADSDLILGRRSAYSITRSDLCVRETALSTGPLDVERQCKSPSDAPHGYFAQCIHAWSKNQWGGNGTSRPMLEGVI